MIATILPSSPTFHAVAYNEKKVAQGSATLLELKNFGPIDTLGYSTPEKLSEYLIEYSSKNDRIKQPQFHLAVSCKGHEYSEEQLVEFAHRYLEEMGYGDPEQPLLIYGHHDTENTHIHIITSRVNPKGKKIKDSNERRRSQKIIDKLMKTDLKADTIKDLKAAMQFDFRNINQFRAVMEAMKYECYESEGMICIKKGGMIQAKVEIEEINKKALQNKSLYKNDVAENARWRAIFKKYRDTNSSRTGLERDLKKLFGLSLVFFGKKDTPYGYVAIDFNKKQVLEGGKILGIKELLDFMTPEEHIDEIEEFINNSFDQNPHITTKELNKKLRRMGAYVRKESIVFGEIRKVLAESHRAILDRNNKIEWRNGFKPQTEQERDLLCKLTGYQFPNLISISICCKGKYYCKDFKELQGIFNISESKERVMAFETAGFKIVTERDDIYAYRPETQTLTNLSKAGFDRELYAPLVPNHNNNSQKEPEKKNVGKKNITPSRDGSHYANREWEVGKKEKDKDDMDKIDNISY